MASERVEKMLWQVRTLLGLEGSAAIADNDIMLALTLGQLELLARLPDVAVLPLCTIAQQSISAGEDEIALPSDFVRCRLVLFNEQVCRPWKIEELYVLQLYPDLTPSEAQPFFYLWANNLYLLAGEHSGGTLTMHYVRKPQNISLSQEPELPAVYDRLICDYAAALLAENRALYPVSEAYLLNFNEGVRVIATRGRNEPPYDGLTSDAALL